eukprot:1637452-Alexandrium_andersonii.AAC.1
MSASLVGSEMCIRDRYCAVVCCLAPRYPVLCNPLLRCGVLLRASPHYSCLLYTSDAADDM